MRISVVIPTKNKSSSISNVLKSLDLQDISHDEFEAIVVDDTSDEPVSRYVNPAEYGYPLSVIRLGKRRSGAGCARNAGVASAKSPLILFLDADVMLKPDALRWHIAAHENPCCQTAVLGEVLSLAIEDNWLRSYSPASIDVSDIDGTFKRARAAGFDDRRLRLLRKRCIDFEQLIRPWLFFFTDHVSVPLANFHEIGGFDEDLLGKGSEDIDFGYRLTKNGVGIAFAHQARGIHQVHPRSYDEEARQDRTHEFRLLEKYCSPEMEDLVTHDYIIASLGARSLMVLDEITVPEEMQLKELATVSPFMNSRSIIVGALPHNAIMQSRSRLILERNRTRHYVSNSGDCRFLPLLGTATPFSTESFDTSIITPIWQVLPTELCARLFHEQCRIAKRVILIKTSVHQPELYVRWWKKISEIGSPYWHRFFRIARDFKDFQYTSLVSGQGTPDSPTLIEIRTRRWLEHPYNNIRTLALPSTDHRGAKTGE